MACSMVLRGRSVTNSASAGDTMGLSMRRSLLFSLTVRVDYTRTNVVRQCPPPLPTAYPARSVVAT